MAKYSSGILEIVNRAGGHMTAEQVFLEMKRQYPSVVMATIYNNLNSLCAQGAIRRLSVEGQPDRYDRTLRHDHLVCRGCGKLKDVFLGDLTEYLRTKHKAVSKGSAFQRPVHHRKLLHLTCQSRYVRRK